MDERESIPDDLIVVDLSRADEREHPLARDLRSSADVFYNHAYRLREGSDRSFDAQADVLDGLGDDRFDLAVAVDEAHPRGTNARVTRATSEALSSGLLPSSVRRRMLREVITTFRWLGALARRTTTGVSTALSRGLRKVRTLALAFTVTGSRAPTVSEFSLVRLVRADTTLRALVRSLTLAPTGPPAHVTQQSITSWVATPALT